MMQRRYVISMNCLYSNECVPIYYKMNFSANEIFLPQKIIFNKLIEIKVIILYRMKSKRKYFTFIQMITSEKCFNNSEMFASLSPEVC